MRKARPGGASGNGPQALDQSSQDQDNTPTIPGPNAPQSFRLLGDIAADIIGDLSRHRARPFIASDRDG